MRRIAPHGLCQLTVHRQRLQHARQKQRQLGRRRRLWLGHWFGHDGGRNRPRRRPTAREHSAGKQQHGEVITVQENHRH